MKTALNMLAPVCAANGISVMRDAMTRTVIFSKQGNHVRITEEMLDDTAPISYAYTALSSLLRPRKVRRSSARGATNRTVSDR